MATRGSDHFPVSSVTPFLPSWKGKLRGGPSGDCTSLGPGIGDGNVSRVVLGVPNGSEPVGPVGMWYFSRSVLRNTLTPCCPAAPSETLRRSTLMMILDQPISCPSLPPGDAIPRPVIPQGACLES